MTAGNHRSFMLGTIAALSIALVLSTTSAAESPISAWQELVQHHPAAVSQLSADQRAVLEALSPEEARRWSIGAPLDEILTLDGRTLADWLADTKLAGPSFEMPWWSVDGGGGVSSGGGFTLAGTIGEPDTGVSSGGLYTLAGGFWGTAYSDIPFFADGFEDGTTGAWSATSP